MYSTTSRSMAPTSITLFFLLLFPFTFAGSNCPPLGPVLPAPKSPSSNNAVQFALVGLSAEFETLASSYNATAISIAVASIHEKGPMLDLGHTPSIHNKRGTKKVDINTVYRIASVSKVFTVLALLQLKGKINLADPVTKYVPELRQLKKQEDTINDITTVDWDEVTIDALASQLSDIGQNCTLSLKSVATKARWLTFVIIVGEDLRNQDIPYTELGFPVLPPEAASMCGGAPGERGCTRGGKMQHIPNPTLHRLIIISDFFAKFGKRHPAYAPYTTPVYSNIAYTILGFVIEAATHGSYENYMQRAIFEPLSMTRTTVGKPSKDNIGFIPSETNWWSTDLGIENPYANHHYSSQPASSI
jgi:CubicO group peptidase (beta-lactamase class C family)